MPIINRIGKNAFLIIPHIALECTSAPRPGALLKSPSVFLKDHFLPQMNLSIIIIVVKVKTPDNMIETLPHSLQ